MSFALDRYLGSFCRESTSDHRTLERAPAHTSVPSPVVFLVIFVANMSPAVSSKAAPIVIVGAGVFGLSTAIHLARRGYTNVTILDKQAYDESQYSYAAGCDAASAGE